jgi:hypothetical protein
MRWKITKRYVTVAGIFGASSWTTPRRAFVAQTAEWGNRILSSMGILSVYRGRENSTLKHSPNQSSRGTQFFPEFGTAVIRTVVIRSI